VFIIIVTEACLHEVAMAEKVLTKAWAEVYWEFLFQPLIKPL